MFAFFGDLIQFFLPDAYLRTHRVRTQAEYAPHLLIFQWVKVRTQKLAYFINISKY